MTPRLPVGRTAAVLGAAGHVGPAATWLPAVRRRTPRLAGRGRRDHVALTFDDGPGPESTPRFLEALECLDVRATFFMLGEHLHTHRSVARAVADAGHELAVHGWTHAFLLGQPYPLVYRRLARARDAVASVTGRPPTWFRPPYGVLTGDAAAAARALGLRPVLWTAWARDWTADATATSVLETLGPGIEGGATLLLHDADHTTAPGAWRATLAALPEIVHRCARLGLTPGPLRDHGVATSRGPITTSGGTRRRR